MLIFFYWCVVWSRFFYWRKELGWADLSDTLNMFVKSIKKFLEAFEKKFQPKKWGFVRIFQPDFELHFFKISTFFHFSWHKIWLVRRAVTIFLLTQKARLGGPFRYLEHVRQANGKFSRGLWKKSFSPKNSVLSEYSNPVLSFIFQNINIFHVYLDIIWLLSHVFMILSLKGRYISRRHTHTLKMIAKATEKVLEVFEKSFSSKHEFRQNIPTWFLSNLNSLRFSWHIIWSVHCVVTIFFTEQTQN